MGETDLLRRRLQLSTAALEDEDLIGLGVQLKPAQRLQHLDRADVTMPTDDADNGRVGDDPPLESGVSDFARPNDGSDFPAEHPWVDWLSQDPRERCLSECLLL